MSDSRPISVQDLHKLFEQHRPPEKTWWQKIGVGGLIGLAGIALAVGALYFKTNEAAAVEHAAITEQADEDRKTTDTLAKTIEIVQRQQMTLTEKIAELQELHPRN